MAVMVDHFIGDPGDARVDPQGLVDENSPKDVGEGKHIVIGVKNFNSSPDPTTSMSSYLRLGSAGSWAGDQSSRQWGEDLAALVNGFTDDLRDRSDGAPAAALPPAIVLDHASPANHDTSQDDSGQSLDARRKESKVLHTKGGWRDHSDGNRVTTTRGDKVEVIRGNYKLVVLGRQDSDSAIAGGKQSELLQNAAGFDWSGGLTDNGDLEFAWDPEQAPPQAHPPQGSSRNPPIMSVEYQWALDTDGHWAWTQTTQTGSDTASDFTDPNAAGNFRIISKTYVDYSEANLGSTNKYVDTVLSNTFTHKMTTNVTADTNVSNTWGNDITVNTHTGTLTQNTTVDGISETNSSALILGSLQMARLVWNDLTMAPLIQETQLAAVKDEIDVAEMLISLVQLSSFQINLLLSAESLNVMTGEVNDFHTGIHYDMHTGIHTDLHLGEHIQVDAQAVTVTSQSLTANAQTVTVNGDSITASSGSVDANTSAAIRIASSHIHM
jgi:hypothetical protein